MAKIAIIGDMHIGARNSNKIVEKWQNKFFDELFFPYLEENKISTIIQLGDFFDNRKWINVQSIDNMVQHVIKPSKDLDWHVLIGNHDIPLRNTLQGHTPGMLLSHYDNFTVYDSPKTVEFDDSKLTIMPWICKENEDECLDVIAQGGDTIIGHFEIGGALMHPGSICKEGLSANKFNNWKRVWSGHFHSQSYMHNIKYLGTPYQMSWSDSTTKHGFWIYDTFEESLQFIENKFRYFHRIVWNNGTDYDLESIKDGYVKINVENKDDFEAFEKFIDQVNYNSPFELKIIESFEEYNQENVQDLIEVSTTENLISEYIDEVASQSSKESVKEKMIEIYQEALEIEE